LCGFFSSDGFSTRGDDDSFAEAINDNEHGVSVSGFWEVRNKVHSDRFPNTSRDWVWLHGNLGAWLVFSSLADGTPIYVVLGKLGKARPPVFSGDEFVGLPSSRVAYGRVVMVQFNQVAAEGVVFGNVNVATVKDDTIF
jgi:hypothetical protein